MLSDTRARAETTTEPTCCVKGGRRQGVQGNLKRGHMQKCCWRAMRQARPKSNAEYAATSFHVWHADRCNVRVKRCATLPWCHTHSQVCVVNCSCCFCALMQLPCVWCAYQQLHVAHTAAAAQSLTFAATVRACTLVEASSPSCVDPVPQTAVHSPQCLPLRPFQLL